MKKFFKIMMSSLLLIVILTLTSCGMSKANVYRYWKNASVELSKSHILEKVTYKTIESKVEKMKESSDTIYVFYGDSSDSDSKSNVIVFNEQAIQFNIETLYWIDSTDLSDKTKTKIEDELGVKNADKLGCIWSFTYQKDSDGNRGKIFFDSSKNKYSTFTNVQISELVFHNKLEF